MEVKRGKGSVTHVHPLVAIRLAQWLSPDFKSALIHTAHKE